ncbi:hypothetical protein ACFPN7_15410 [Amycolatopsis halotolerans]|uniref:hypothetical protein n=1 Tax=Amycolatopsis halotolerans TaxID=330083 RepID=UPI003614BC9A
MPRPERSNAGEPNGGHRVRAVLSSHKGRRSVVRRRRGLARAVRHARPGEPFTNNSPAPETLARTAETGRYQHFPPGRR